MPRLRPRRRALPGGAGGKAARWVAPAVFLLAATGIVLLVRSSLRGDEQATPTTRSAPAHRTTVARATKPRVRVPAQWYLIRSGDTLDAIAGRFSTSVDDLLRLNPGVEPTTLRPGERLRIK